MNDQHAASQYDLDVEFAFIYAKDPKQAYEEKDSEDEKVGEISNEDNDVGDAGEKANDNNETDNAQD